MRRLALLLVLLVAGCANSRQITNLDGYLPKHEAESPHHVSVDTVLRHYFTDEAYQLVKDIPLIDGPAINGYAAGTTVLSNLASIMTLNGWGRKVILTAKVLGGHWGVKAIIHEYIHHVDDMCRDGEQTLIDVAEFDAAFQRLGRDFTYAWISINVLRNVADYPPLYDELISLGPLSEHIAFTAANMAVASKGPDYMWRVFKRVLRRD